MAVCTRRLVLAMLAAGGGLCVGCDAATLAYFFLPESREPAKIKSLASADSKKPAPKVVILTWSGLETRSEFIHADRQISELLGARLAKLADDYGEKLQMIPPRKVENYKNRHPRWQQEDPAEIGRNLEADYVIYLEITALSLYEQGSANQLYKGRAQINVELIDVNHPDESPSQKAFSCTYPSDARGSEPAGLDMSAAQFREQFFAAVAKNLAQYFSHYAKRETFYTE
jgi:hypothetical protein